MGPMRRVAGFGIANIDIIFGQAQRMPLLGEEIYSGTLSRQLGGGAVATMIQLSRLGVPVKLATYIGKGDLSRFLIKELDRHHIDYTNMLCTEEEDPVTLSAVVSCPGDRGIISYKPDPCAFRTDMDKIYRFYEGSEIAYVSLEHKEIYPELKKSGCLIVLDSAWDDAMCLSDYQDAFPHIDYFIPNAKEAMQLTGAASAEEALEILSHHLKVPIIKNGEQGSLYFDRGRIACVRPYPAKHKDSTGAGDAFAAGLIYGLFHRYPLQDCIRFGNISGANAVTKIGCLSAEIDEETLLSRYRNDS